MYFENTAILIELNDAVSFLDCFRLASLLNNSSDFS